MIPSVRLGRVVRPLPLPAPGPHDPRPRRADRPSAARLTRPSLAPAHAHTPRRLGGARGQASVEVVAFLPLVVLIALAAFTAISAHAADEQAGEAAEAAALALLQGGADPRAAAKHALPQAARGRATIDVSGPRVRVRVRPRLFLPVPGLADRLAGKARADAGGVAP